MSEPNSPENSPRVEEPAVAYDPTIAGVRARRQLADAGFSHEHAEAVVS